MFMWNSIPWLALITLGLYKSTVLSPSTIVSKLKATALLIIVPKLPGSWISSNSNILFPNSFSSFLLHIAITLLGDSKSLI